VVSGTVAVAVVVAAASESQQSGAEADAERSKIHELVLVLHRVLQVLILRILVNMLTGNEATSFGVEKLTRLRSASYPRLARRAFARLS